MRTNRTNLVALVAALILGGYAAASPAADSDKAAAGTTETGKPDSSKAYEANHQIEAGARQIGRGVEQAAKDIGHGVKQGTEAVGAKIKEAANEAEPRARNAWQKFKDGAAEAGRSVRNFLDRLFSA
ncbi:MAG: hypothetical protein HYX43_09760 [Burkholderiales bacterium]|nr:hypothetical protein [Burkholderiales bacterium]